MRAAMSNLELTEALLAKLAGWEAMKQARALLETGRVVSSTGRVSLLRSEAKELSQAEIVAEQPASGSLRRHRPPGAPRDQFLCSPTAFGTNAAVSSSDTEEL